MDAEKNISKEPQDTPAAGYNSIASTTFETALTAAGFGKFNYLILLLTVPASCSSPFVTASMSYVVPVAGSDLGLTPMSKALLQSAPYAGMISSAFLWGVLSDSFGRQPLIAAGFIADFVMNSLCALIPSLTPMLVFKFLSGVMVCGPYSIFMAYLSEVFLEKKRDFAVLSSGIFACGLTIVHACMAMVIIPSSPPQWLPLKSWQVFILASGAPSLLTGLASAFCPESPKFLAEKGNTQAALRVCRKIYCLNTGLHPDSYPVKCIEKPEGSSEAASRSRLGSILAAAAGLRPPFVNRLLMIFAMQIAMVISANLLRLWLPEMLTVMANADPGVVNQTKLFCPLLESGHRAKPAEVVSSHDAYFNMIVLNSCSLAAQVLFFFLVKCISKKTIIMGASGVAAASVITIPFIDAEYVFIPSSITVSILSIAFFCQIALIVQIFPTSIRATSVSLNLMVGGIGVLAVNFLVAHLMYSYCQYMFYALCFLCIGVIVICLFLDTTPFGAESDTDKQT